MTRVGILPGQVFPIQARTYTTAALWIMAVQDYVQALSWATGRDIDTGALLLEIGDTALQRGDGKTAELAYIRALSVFGGFAVAGPMGEACASYGRALVQIGRGDWLGALARIDAAWDALRFERGWEPQELRPLLDDVARRCLDRLQVGGHDDSQRDYEVGGGTVGGDGGRVYGAHCIDESARRDAL